MSLANKIARLSVFGSETTLWVSPDRTDAIVVDPANPGQVPPKGWVCAGSADFLKPRPDISPLAYAKVMKGVTNAPTYLEFLRRGASPPGMSLQRIHTLMNRSIIADREKHANEILDALPTD